MGKPVVEVIGIGAHPISGHIAAIIVSVGDTPAGEEALEAIHRHRQILVGVAGKGMDVIGQGAARRARRRVSAKDGHHLKAAHQRRIEPGPCT